VLRLLDKEGTHLNLTDLGMNQNDLKQVQQLISNPHGIILVTGPTGSGKTTSLYATLSKLNNSSRNILTVEDPIEYFIDGIGQTQINTKIDMTFAKGLRAILRQDPDVVMLGEIRDHETAEIAVQASLTGHLVLSTLHTNSAIGAITRLRDLKIQSFLLSSSLKGIISQRLVRVLCTHCKKLRKTTEKEQTILLQKHDSTLEIYDIVGCKKCDHTGYSGRTGLFEIVSIDDNLLNLIHEGKSEQKIKKHVRNTTPNLLKSGCEKVLNGETSITEVLRVTSDSK